MKPASKLRVTNCAYVNGKTQRERSEGGGGNSLTPFLAKEHASERCSKKLKLRQNKNIRMSACILTQDLMQTANAV